MPDAVSITTAGEGAHPSLLSLVSAKAEARAIPLSVQMDLTWACNEGCVHCYLDHSVGGDMDTAEIKGVLDQLAAAGAMFLTLSGGEIMLRKDIFEIVAYARSLLFDVRLKTNGILIGEREADRFVELGVREVKVSIYSHLPEAHDAVTRVPGSFARSIEALKRLKSRGLRVGISVSVMKGGADYARLRALAEELGASILYDATIVPMMDGDKTPVLLNISPAERAEFYANPAVLFKEDDACASPASTGGELMDGHSCGAGHVRCYITPQGDVTPCVQFPLVCGNLRQSKFLEIWTSSPQFAEVRGIRNRDLNVCSSCSSLSSCDRCPGLAFQEGDMRGASRQTCEDTYFRTKVPNPLYPGPDLDPAPQRRPQGSGQFVPLAALLPAARAGSYRDSASH
jgi:radical SAM protein with 4Fe4S-binding SPASM domain